MTSNGYHIKRNIYLISFPTYKWCPIVPKHFIAHRNQLIIRPATIFQFLYRSFRAPSNITTLFQRQSDVQMILFTSPNKEESQQAYSIVSTLFQRPTNIDKVQTNLTSPNENLSKVLKREVYLTSYIRKSFTITCYLNVHTADDK